MALHRVCSTEELPPGTVLGFDVNGQHLIVANVEGKIYAAEGICTHEEFDLAMGFLVEDRITCSLHLSAFELPTGQVVNPPATRPLNTFKVILEDESVYVDV